MAGGTVVQAAGKAANSFDSSITTALILAGLLVAGVVLILATGAGESLKKGVIPV